MRNIEGIDQIKLTLNPLFLNDKIAAKRHIDPYNRLRIKKVGMFYQLCIEDEYFVQTIDYQWQIAFAISELVKSGLYGFQYNMFIPLFIHDYPQYFMLNIIELEFYFDFQYKNISVPHDKSTTDIAEADKKNLLYQYRVNDTSTSTFYTSDYIKRKPIGIICDKNKKRFEGQSYRQNERRKQS